MSEVVAQATGLFCWVELGTTDAEAAKTFYTELLGWNATDAPTGPDTTYTMLQLGDQDVAGLYTLQEEQKAQNVPPHWGLYVSVESADDAAEKAKTLGGTVLVEPSDVMEAGRLAIIKDPTGATFSVWEARDHEGTAALNVPGALCWSELATRDSEKAGAFYAELFDWEIQVEQMSAGPYTLFKREEQNAAGMMQMNEEWGDLPPHWMPYLGVTDCDATAAKATALGGAVSVEPFDIPDVGRMAVIRDPQGAVFSIITLTSFA